MYPDIPYNGLSWPITQHSGIISENVVKGLISACFELNGKPIDVNAINNFLVSHGIVTDNFRSDSMQVDAWRDYQQILSEFGLIYSTKISNRIILTPVAIAFADGDISYQELITLQLLRYQYPNGQKTQISKTLKSSYEQTGKAFCFSSYAEMQANHGILIRPVVAIWQILFSLYKKGENATLSIDELQTYVVRCLKNSDVDFCVDAIIKSRHSVFQLAPLERARRNMQDWIKLLNQTPLFYSDYSRSSTISLSSYSIEQAEAISAICNYLCKPETFWIYKNNDSFKSDWFNFYGEIDLGTNWIPIPQEDAIINSDETPSEDKFDETIEHSQRSIDLQEFKPMYASDSNVQKTIVSIYDYKKSEKGHRLHDNMVNLIASKCIAKGAEVAYDPKTVDLFIKYKSKEFLVEVKSTTPSNFIARLRTAIGQVCQYDYLMHRDQNSKGRLGLAFTACIPKYDWSIPFITNYMNMDLLYMESNSLTIRSLHKLSLELYG